MLMNFKYNKGFDFYFIFEKKALFRGIFIPIATNDKILIRSVC